MLDICMSPSFVSRSKVTPLNWNISACSCEQWKNVSEFLNPCASELLITFRNSEKSVDSSGRTRKIHLSHKGRLLNVATVQVLFLNFTQKPCWICKMLTIFWKSCFHTIKAHWSWSVSVSLSLCSAAFNTTSDRCPPDNITQRTNSKII